MSAPLLSIENLSVSFVDDSGEVCVVDEFYVAEEVRGQGHGTALIEGLKAGAFPWFRRAVALELEVTPTNARARALYERMGFAPRKNATLRLRR